MGVAARRNQARETRHDGGGVRQLETLGNFILSAAVVVGSAGGES